MQTAIETIQKAIFAEKHQLINHFEIRDKLISQLSDNNSSQIHCQQKIENLERELKEICGNFYDRKDQCAEKMTTGQMSTMKANISSAIKSSHSEDCALKDGNIRG